MNHPVFMGQNSIKNTEHLRKRFKELLMESDDRGIIGVADFRDCYENLILAQQKRLKIITGDKFLSLLDSGFFISIGIVYPTSVINRINVRTDHGVDMTQWNYYADEYNRLNDKLDQVARILACEYNGIAIPATLSGFTQIVNHVTDYFEQTISHRLIAEMAGLGWRGKNGLTITKEFNCALRFVSIITDVPLKPGTRCKTGCGDCNACEEVCTFIKNREILPDYRENCRRYINYLQSMGLKEEVCGKCIQACYQRSSFSD